MTRAWKTRGRWPGRKGCPPQMRPMPAASRLHTQTEHIGCDQQGTGRDLGKGLMVGLQPLRGLWGVICSPEWQVRNEVACREGWPGSKPSARGCSPVACGPSGSQGPIDKPWPWARCLASPCGSHGRVAGSQGTAIRRPASVPDSARGQQMPQASVGFIMQT